MRPATSLPSVSRNAPRRHREAVGDREPGLQHRAEARRLAADQRDLRAAAAVEGEDVADVGRRSTRTLVGARNVVFGGYSNDLVVDELQRRAAAR